LKQYNGQWGGWEYPYSNSHYGSIAVIPAWDAGIQRHGR